MPHHPQRQALLGPAPKQRASHRRASSSQKEVESGLLQLQSDLRISLRALLNKMLTVPNNQQASGSNGNQELFEVPHANSIS